jgi:triphosphatase
MQMLLDVHPDDARHLPRSKLLTRKPGTRPRYRSVLKVWHDSPDRALQAEGLALEEDNGIWRLIRLIPGEEPWLPAQPAPVIGEALMAADVGHALPEDLQPIAAFDGRLTSSVLDTADGEVSVALLRGAVGDTPFAQLTLDGPDEAVRGLALALAGSLRIEVPQAGLAAMGLAAARGETPPPQHLGHPKPIENASVTDAFTRAIGHFTDVLLHFAPRAASGDADTEPVHQMRVAVRRARSAIRAFRQAVGCAAVTDADRALKDMSTILGPARDWDVLVTETLPRVSDALPDDPALRRLCDAAQQHREIHNAELRDALTTPGFRQLGVSLAWLCGSTAWHRTLPAEQQAVCAMVPADFAALVMQKRWKKVAAAGKTIEGLDLPSLHAVRLHAKRARYAIEVFLPHDAGRQAHRLLRRLTRLQDDLGTLNDGATAVRLLGDLGGATGVHAYAVGLVLGYVAASTATIRPRVFGAWEKFRRTPRFWA